VGFALVIALPAGSLALLWARRWESPKFPGGFWIGFTRGAIAGLHRAVLKSISLFSRIC